MSVAGLEARVGGAESVTKRRPAAGPFVTWLLKRCALAGFLRVVDRRAVRALEWQGVASAAVSLLEVAALAAVEPLVQMLSGGSLDGTGVTGQLVQTWTAGLDVRARALAVVGFVVSLLVLRAALSALLRWYTIGTLTEGSSRATAALLFAYTKAPLAFHSQRNSAQATRTASYSITSIYAAGLLGISTVLTETALLVFVGSLLMVVTPIGAASAVIYFGIAMAVYSRVVQRRTAGAARRRDQLQAAWLALLHQVLGGLREIRLRGAEEEYSELFARARSRQNRTERRIIFAAEFGRYYLEATFMLGFGLLASVILLSQGARSAAVLGILLAAGFRLLPSASRLLNAFSRIREGQGSLSLLLEELDAMGRDSLPLGGERLGPQTPHSEPAGVSVPMSAEFKTATFCYPGSDRAALSGVSGVIRPGRSLGIVGPSGAGKTTAVDLLCGLLLPTEGEVLVDRIRTTEEDKGWQRRISYVPQDVFLFDGTLRQNIAFTTSGVDDARLREAVELSQLGDWIRILPEGLDTQVGERGVLLSGGQRQRIGIARALYRRPAMLILDEATSALDVETEAYVTAAINNLSGGVTLVVVAHRLSTVRHCDEILMLDQGRQVGWATFSELSASNSMFSRWLALAGMATPE
jgi:ABC-type multidrug transport system fused ATPase/permease subunit